jgi:diguanylate cyclase (GGDEF)-like protein
MQVLAVLLVVLMVATQFAGFLFTVRQHEALIDVRNDTRDMRITQQSLVDAEDAVADYILAPDGAYLDRYFAARELLEAHRTTSIRRLDEIASPRQVASGRRPAAETVARLERLWERALSLVKTGRRDEARALIQEGVYRQLIDVRGDITRYLVIRNAAGDEYEERREFGNKVVTGLQLFGGALIIGVLLLAFRLSSAEGSRRRAAARDAVAAREQTEKLFRMTDMLQSAAGYDDANAVLQATVQGLMPDLAGAMFIFNNSRDRLDLSTSWNIPDTHLPPDHIAPSTCWALKRGKAHVNGLSGMLRCEHQRFDGVVLEIPMMARGELYGLLCFAAQGAQAEARVAEINGIATALADAMSLALSSMGLREKLRNQALRDPLTGLYNRRYMEDMLQRFGHLSERNARPMSVIMIDLDHFKRLNDEHGHATGDAVLRDVGAAILATVRQSDVACRYGGEEIIVLLPDINLADATLKAEALRRSIEAISERQGISVTASLGVASVPDNAASAAALVAIADEALYRAKKAGRNQVATAAPRAAAEPLRKPLARIA